MGSIRIAVANLKSSSSSSFDKSNILKLETGNVFSYANIHSHETEAAVNADVSRFLDDIIITFTNTHNSSETNSNCVTTAPLIYTSLDQVTPLVTFTSCSLRKVIAKQINQNEVLIVSVHYGFYGGTEATVHRFRKNGTLTLLQRIPIYYTDDVMFLQTKNALFLVMPNQNQKSDYAVAVEYKVPAQIFMYVKIVCNFHNDVVIEQSW